MTNRLITEVLAWIGLIAPSSQAVGAVTTGPYILDQLRKHVHTLIVGAVGGAGTATYQLQASTTGTGGWVNIPGAVQTLTVSNTMAQIEVRADYLRALNLGSYVQGVLTVAGNAVVTSVLVQGGDARYQLASDQNSTAVQTPVVI